MFGLRNLFSNRQIKTGPYAPLPCPVPPVCIIGDLHGRLDLLEQMLDKTSTRMDAGPHRLIFVGDMIDRGPQSAAILRILYDMNCAAPDRVICLMGNHERMMLDFLDDPVQHGPRWLANGGNETLASFGVSPWARSTANSSENRLKGLAAALATALPEEITHWLASRPLLWSEGALVVTHAGADPACPITNQMDETFLWGHSAFARTPRSDGLWVAHGHTIQPTAKAESGRVSVDTGAWRTGRLSAAWLNGDGVNFIEVTDRPA
ncbi:serine/threonine protein phosphatase (plasmid) [Pseudorhodobacter turbinis]|uniref:Serine/threonine protein phosphatase n=1 Tax=Pseudorhodobacter turbinis TaxID=2500533 RepID=A0A4P8EM79_9RHOB|nr:metallophosphoesterase [Pseudorhodobacter turbinis]QCO58139.1 serine/threonine protein phosphatase [Pseudorhodobacter turbinis]